MMTSISFCFGNHSMQALCPTIVEIDENQGGQTKNLWRFAPNFLQKYLPTLILNRAGAPGVYRPMYATCVLPYTV